MARPFFLNPLHNRVYSWAGLLAELNATKALKPFCYERDYFQIFKSILLSLVHDTPLNLLDYDFSPGELQGLGITPQQLQEEIPLNPVPLAGVRDLLDKVQSVRSWRLILYTSGTTGLPKKVEHTWQTLTKAVRVSEQRQKDVWGLAYNPTHIAGLQVFFQALLNQNTLVNLFQLSRETIFERIDRHSITHISATPTFFRMLLPVTRSFHSVARITSGGEKFDPNLAGQLERMFPKAKILNVYASTEAGTLFAARGDVFTIKPETRAYVTIKDNELLIHKDWLAHSAAFELEGDWYHSGDLVEVLSHDPLTFRFISRRNEMINVGGYKVNPLEVEQVINGHDQVQNCHVYGKPHALIGNILICDVRPVDARITEQELRRYLQDKLQDYKIPRLFNFMDKLPTTRSGKLKRE